MNWKLREFQTTIQNYNSKSLVEPEIFQYFKHKIVQILHFTQFNWEESYILEKYMI